MPKIILTIILTIQAIAITAIAYILFDTRTQVKIIPAKVDMLMAATMDNPPEIVQCPEPCKECPDNKKDFDEIKQLIRKLNGKIGAVTTYYYNGCGR